MTDLLSFDLDNVKGETPSDAQLDAQINEALRFCSREIFLFDPLVKFKLRKDKAVYNLHDPAIVKKKVVRPFTVTVNGNKLYNARRDDWGTWAYDEFIDDHHTWEDASSGTPTKAVLYGSASLILHLPPTAAIAASAKNYIAGTVLARDLVSDDDDPTRDSIPTELHEAVVFRAAWKAALPNVSEAEGWRRMAEYKSEWKGPFKEARNQNMRLFGKGTRRTEYMPDYISV